MSTPPKCSTAASTARCTSSSLRTSPTTATPLPPAASTSATAVCTVPGSFGCGSAVLASSTTLAPCLGGAERDRQPDAAAAAGHDQRAVGEAMAGLARHRASSVATYSTLAELVVAFSFYASAIITVYRGFGRCGGASLRTPCFACAFPAERYWHSHFLQVRYPMMTRASADPLRHPAASPSTDRATGPADPPAPGAYPFTRGNFASGYRGKTVDVPPVFGLRHRRGVQPPLPLPARPGRHRACRSRSTCRPSAATTPTTRSAARRSAGSASRSTPWPTPRSCSTASRWTRSAPASPSTARPRSCWRSTSPPPRRRACRARSSPAPSRTTSSRSTRRAAPGSGRRSRRCD